MDRPGSDSLDAATDCAWGMFEDTLICGLGRIGSGEVLALIAPTGPSGWADQLAIRGDTERGWMWVTHGGEGRTAAEEMVARVGEDGAVELARAIVHRARAVLRLPHPQLFTARATGEAAACLADQLGLAVAPDVVDSGAAGRPDVVGRVDVAVGGPDALRPLAADVIRDVCGQDPLVDDDGDLAFDIDGTRCFMIFSRDGSVVQISSKVVRRIYSRRNTAVELDLLNSKGVWTTWFMSGREVFLRSAVPARPLTADNLQRTLRCFVQELCGTREELSYRLGGVAA